MLNLIHTSPLVFSIAALLLSILLASASAGRPLLDTSLTTSLLAITVPDTIAVPSGYKLQLSFYGVGDQHYAFNGTSWVLQNATAQLYTYDGASTSAGEHFFLPEKDAQGGQPSWKSYDAESLVTAKTMVAVTVDVSSITWNLLEATSESGSKDLLGDVSYVQRIQTKGGLPPATSEGAKKGDTLSSSYTATYAFYVKDATFEV